jgi:hypothetical protein
MAWALLHAIGDAIAGDTRRAIQSELNFMASVSEPAERRGDGAAATTVAAPDVAERASAGSGAPGGAEAPQVPHPRAKL